MRKSAPVEPLSAPVVMVSVPPTAVTRRLRRAARGWAIDRPVDRPVLILGLAGALPRDVLIVSVPNEVRYLAPARIPGRKPVTVFPVPPPRNRVSSPHRRSHGGVGARRVNDMVSLQVSRHCRSTGVELYLSSRLSPASRYEMSPDGHPSRSPPRFSDSALNVLCFEPLRTLSPE